MHSQDKRHVTGAPALQSVLNHPGGEDAVVQAAGKIYDLFNRCDSCSSAHGRSSYRVKRKRAPESLLAQFHGGAEGIGIIGAHAGDRK